MMKRSQFPTRPVRAEFVLVVLAVALGSGAGCKKTFSDEVAVTPTTAGPTVAAEEPEKSQVVVDEAIAELCDMPVPHFPFNSAKIAKQAKSSLEILAECFINGKGKGKRMALVGHTDPRGEDDYNLALGQRRADSVAKYLVGKGLGTDRMDVSSRGEMDATGADEAGWETDRSVEIRLASN